MKKILFLLSFVTIAAAAFSQSNEPTPKTKQGKPDLKAAAPLRDSTQPQLLVLQGTVEAYQALITALDKSTESHLTITAIKEWIVPQLQKQLQAPATKK